MIGKLSLDVSIDMSSIPAEKVAAISEIVRETNYQIGEIINCPKVERIVGFSIPNAVIDGDPTAFLINKPTPDLSRRKILFALTNKGSATKDVNGTISDVQIVLDKEISLNLANTFYDGVCIKRLRRELLPSNTSNCNHHPTTPWVAEVWKEDNISGWDEQWEATILAIE